MIVPYEIEKPIEGCKKIPLAQGVFSTPSMVICQSPRNLIPLLLPNNNNLPVSKKGRMSSMLDMAPVKHTLLVGGGDGFDDIDLGAFSTPGAPASAPAEALNYLWSDGDLGTRVV